MKRIKLDLGRTSIEDLVPDIELPEDLSKMSVLQKQQVTNYFKNMDPKSLQATWNLLAKKIKYNEKEGKSLQLLSNLIYAAKLQRKRGPKSVATAAYNSKFIRDAMGDDAVNTHSLSNSYWGIIIGNNPKLLALWSDPKTGILKQFKLRDFSGSPSDAEMEDRWRAAINYIKDHWPFEELYSGLLKYIQESGRTNLHKELIKLQSRRPQPDGRKKFLSGLVLVLLKDVAHFETPKYLVESVLDWVGKYKIANRKLGEY